MPETPATLQTQRLLLRRWKPSDIAPFIRMNAEADVMRFFPAPLSPAQTRQSYARIQAEFEACGYGLFAAETLESGDFIGFIGFHRAQFAASFCPCIEIGWRLDSRYWGNGYATEGANACLKHGFSQLGFTEIYSFTAALNKPSERVMQKIGMQFHQHFDHPAVAEGHILRPHICYKISK